MRLYKQFLCILPLLAVFTNAQNIKIQFAQDSVLNLYSKSEINISKGSDETTKEEIFSHKSQYKKSGNKDVLKVQYDSLSIQYIISKDSFEVHNTNAPKSYLSLLLKYTTNKEYKVSFDPEKRNVSLTNYDNVFSDLYKNIYKKRDENMDFVFSSKIRQILNENIALSDIEEIYPAFPLSAVNDSSTWDVTSHHICGLNGIIETHYRVNYITDMTIKITSRGTITNEEKECSKYSIDGVSYILSNIKGTFTKSIVINRNTGWIKSGEISLRLKGKCKHGTSNNSKEENLSISINKTIRDSLKDDL